jgi:hypothetical protein
MTKTILLTASVILTLLSCSKSDDSKTSSPTATFATAPETKQEHDNTSFGVYKGLIMTTNQSIKVVINNGDDIAKVYIYEDGFVKDILSTTATFAAGEAINGAQFSSSNSSMTFSADANGSNPLMENITITGLRINLTATMKRETSLSQVFCYQGSYRSDYPDGENGIFKCFVIGNQVEGANLDGYVQSSDGYTATASAVLNDNSFNATFGSTSSGSSFVGVFTEYACEGTWQNTDDGGTFRGNRSL